MGQALHVRLKKTRKKRGLHGRERPPRSAARPRSSSRPATGGMTPCYRACPAASGQSRLLRSLEGLQRVMEALAPIPHLAPQKDKKTTLRCGPEANHEGYADASELAAASPMGRRARRSPNPFMPLLEDSDDGVAPAMLLGVASGTSILGERLSSSPTRASTSMHVRLGLGDGSSVYLGRVPGHLPRPCDSTP